MASKKSEEIIDELVQLSVDIIKFCKKTDLPKSVASQITRSVTSMGANFAEAQDASSRKDFVNKIYISKKESIETKYWLAIIKKLTDSTEIDGLMQRIQRFLMMFQKIISTSKERKSKQQSAAT